MIACDWCVKKKEGRWQVVITDRKEGKYNEKVTDVTLCDAHYEPIRAIAVKGGESK